MDKNLAVFIGAPQNAGQVQFLGINLIPDTGLDLCPVDTYLSDDMKCYSNPVMSLKASVYPQTINNSLYWTFTTQNSFFIDPSYLNTLQPTWSFKDATMEAIVASS